MRGYLSFRTMLSGSLVSIVYVLGAVVITVLSVAMIAGVYHEVPYYMPWYVSRDKAVPLIGIGLLVFGNIAWRLLCEGWAVLFSIHDRLLAIEQGVESFRWESQRHLSSINTHLADIDADRGRNDVSEPTAADSA